MDHLNATTVRACHAFYNETIMDDNKDVGNPFSIPDLWRLPKSHVEGLVVPSLLFSELNIDGKVPAIWKGMG